MMLKNFGLSKSLVFVLAFAVLGAGTVLANMTVTTDTIVGDYKLVIVDMTSATTTGQYTLPSTSGRDEDIYTIKARGTSSVGFEIFPAVGDTFDSGDDNIAHLDVPGGNSHQSYTLIADDVNNTWHLVGKGEL